MENLSENNKTKVMGLLAKGVSLSMMITIIMIFILSVILSFSDLKESVIMPMVIFISSFSILVGAFFISKKIDEKGIVYGSALGILYMLILYIISSIINSNFCLNSSAICMIIFGVLGGAIGGIIGVNLK